MTVALRNVHGASTASATVVAMARAAVLSVATSMVPTMATDGSTTATATAYSMATSTSIAAAIHGNQRRMPRQSSTMGISQVEQVLRSEAGVFLILEEPHIPTADRLRGRI